MIVYKGRSLKKASHGKLKLVLSRLPCLGWSLHGSQTLHSICHQFGCKLWLQLIQNHTWHCFQAFECSYLKSLRCSIRIWATPFPLTGRWFRPAALHMIWLGTCWMFATCNQFFCVQDCHSRIFQIGYQGQARKTRILERKPLVDTSYCIQHR